MNKDPVVRNRSSCVNISPTHSVSIASEELTFAAGGVKKHRNVLLTQ